RLRGAPLQLPDQHFTRHGLHHHAVAASAFANDSVGGQRSRPSGVMRLDLLKVVGSSPERRASPDGEIPARSASRSSAPHTWPWVSIFSAFGCLAMGKTRHPRCD